METHEAGVLQLQIQDNTTTWRGMFFAT